MKRTKRSPPEPPAKSQHLILKEQTLRCLDRLSKDTSVPAQEVERSIREIIHEAEKHSIVLNRFILDEEE